MCKVADRGSRVADRGQIGSLDQISLRIRIGAAGINNQ